MSGIGITSGATLNETRRSYLLGQIVFNKRFSTIDCVVRDFSSDGTKINISDTIPLPGTFELIVTQWRLAICSR